MYHKLFHEANDAIYIYEQSMEGSPSAFVEVNDKACEMLGYTRTELLSKSPHDIAAPELRNGVNPIFEKMLEQTNNVVEWVQVSKDGTRIPLEISYKTFRLNHRTMVISIARDLTYRKQTEEFLQSKENISVLGELSAGIAHEIRNPLTSIRGIVQLLFSPSGKDASYRDLILSEVDRINQIIGELLLLGKQSSTELKDRDLLPLMKQIVTLLNAQAHMTGNEIVLDACQDSLVLKCAENKLKQVFINILKNAIEASPKGAEIKVRIRKRKNHAIIRISDNGPGIPAEILNRIGSPFFTTKSGGNGLGIMICRKIIRDHWGTLQFLPHKPSGTVVEISLPLLPAIQE